MTPAAPEPSSLFVFSHYWLALVCLNYKNIFSEPERKKEGEEDINRRDELTAAAALQTRQINKHSSTEVSLKTFILKHLWYQLQQIPLRSKAQMKQQLVTFANKK